jgi:hypothetical protein
MVLFVAAAITSLFAANAAAGIRHPLARLMALQGTDTTP